MAGVLLLNATYEPVKILSMRRAITLVVCGKAEIVHEVEGLAIRSEKLTLPYPSVIRLARHVPIPYQRRLPVTRRNVLERDGHVCAYQRPGICTRRATTVDHIRPKSKGGGHRWENVVAACSPCNAAKSHHQLSELGWPLIVKPTVPMSSWFVAVATRDRRPEWDTYLPAVA